MTMSALRAGALSCALLATTGLITPAMAQFQSPPLHRNLDQNGVDLTHGDHVMSFTEAVVGSGHSELALVRSSSGNGGASSWDGITFDRYLNSNGSVTVWIARGHFYERFDGTVGSLTSNKGEGATLTANGNGYAYRSADGTVIDFGAPVENWDNTQTNFCMWDTSLNPNGHCRLVPLSITAPNGKAVTLEWDIHSIASGHNFPQDHHHYFRLASVSNAFGYGIGFSHIDNELPRNSHPTSNWFVRSGAALWNQHAADPHVGTVSYAYPAAGVVDITDMAGRTWRIEGRNIRRPGETGFSMVVNHANGGVSSVTNDGVTTTYSRSVSGPIATMAVTNALGQQTTIVSDLNIQRPTQITDPLGRTTNFQYDGQGRLTRITAPEGNYIQYTRDARGNVLQTQAVAKPGSGAPTVTTSALYDADCWNPLTCNSPHSSTDARGHVTDYEWDPSHGGIVSVTLPAGPNGIRPQTRYGYEDGLGSVVSACQTQANCAGAADEVKTAVQYDPNGNVIQVTRMNGNGTLAATTTASYTAAGDLATVNGPLPGSDDTTRYRYNGARELIGMVGPDPDGGGPLKHRAIRRSLDGMGRLVKVEAGTVAGQGDGDWPAFAPLEALHVAYDGTSGRVTRQSLFHSPSGALQAETQFSHDALGRPECTAVRMSPIYASAVPASACAQGPQMGHGPDRITRNHFDAAGQVLRVEGAVGTPLQQDEARYTYTLNGQVATLTDGENNRTSYAYDGHDRLWRTIFPAAAKGAEASNPADYEELAYDAAGNIVSRRLRDGQVIGFGYDALGRMVHRDRPNTAWWEMDHYYAHDNLGRLTSASDTNGHAISFAYDALGRRLHEASNWYGITSSAWDLAGRRTRLTHPDGFFVDYGYNGAGEMITVHENGAAMLASYSYDDLGRRVYMVRGNGTVSYHGYDAASRLSALGHHIGPFEPFVYMSRNAAGQIIHRHRNNAALAWTGHYDVVRDYASNGLNQYTQSGPVTPTYDARGNLTSAGAGNYHYTVDNQLAHAPGGNFVYDALGRLFHGTAGNTTDFRYDGTALISEHQGHGGPMLRRYVHGPGTDEPIVWYEGTDLSDKRWLHADERGSIVALTNASSQVIALNSYDEYGIPSTTNVGRFQYTGQTWLPELGMYYYKARIYSPYLGRFPQTDPIGYWDGLNMYAYVKNDPVNFVDPMGMAQCERTGSRIKVSCDSPDAIPHQTENKVTESGRNGGSGSGTGTRAVGPQPPGSGDQVIKVKGWSCCSVWRLQIGPVTLGEIEFDLGALIRKIPWAQTEPVPPTRCRGSRYSCE